MNVSQNAGNIKVKAVVQYNKLCLWN